jgi:DNA-binding beta-propeller fold protein YncE
MRGTRTGGLSSLGVEISGPGALQLDGATLWAIERRSFEWGDEGLSRIDTRSGAMTRIFDTPRAGLADLTALQGYPWVAASEYLSGKVLFVDKTSNRLVHEVDVGGKPYGIAQLRACLVVTSEESKTLSFIGLWGEEPYVVAQWDLTPAGDQLKKPRRITVDVDGGRVFVRSSYPCPTCAGTQSSVYVAEELDGETFEKCSANAQ